MQIEKFVLCLPGLDINSQLINNDLKINQWNLAQLNRFFREGKRVKKEKNYAQILMDYCISDSLKSSLIKRIGLDLSAYYILAAPIYQKTHLHSTSTFSGEDILSFSQQEAEYLCQDLNQLFKEDLIEFIPVLSDLWLIKLPSYWQFHTLSVWDILGFHEERFPISGKDANQLLKMQSEIQMFFFSHPLNKQREKKDLLPINSLWIWEDTVGEADFLKTLFLSKQSWVVEKSDDVLQLDNYDFLNDLEDYIHLLSKSNKIEQIIFLDTFLMDAYLSLDIALYQEKLEWYDQHVLSSILGLYNSNQVKELKLSSFGYHGGEIILNHKKNFFSLFKSNKEIYKGYWIK